MSKLQRIPGSLIAFGIGATEPFEALLDRLGGIPERFIAVEPSVTPGGKLAKRYARLDGVRFIDAFVAGANGEAELTCYSLPGLRSIHRPVETLLKELYPGLRRRFNRSVCTLSPEGVITDLEAVPGPERVHVDLPDAVPALLKKLETAGLLARLELLSIRYPCRQLFEGAWDRAGLQTWLEERFFRLDHADESDPEWPVLLFDANPAERRISALESELAEQSWTLEKERDTATKNAQRVSALEFELAEQSRMREKERDTAAKLREQNAELERELERLQGDLGVALRMQNLAYNDLQELQSRYREAEAARSAQAALLEKLTPRLQQAAAQLRKFVSSETNTEFPALVFGLADRKESTEHTRSKVWAEEGSQSSSAASPKRDALGKEVGD